MAPLITPLTSPRLLLRRLIPSDASALAAYRSDPRVSRFQSWSSYTRADADALIASQAEVIPDTPGTWLQLAITLSSDGSLIGDLGLHFRADMPNQMEIGITLAAPFQGRGYASESIACVLDYAFTTLGKHRVFAITDAKNSAAAALFERAGFRREGNFIENVLFKGDWGDEFLFAVRAEEWSRPG